MLQHEHRVGRVRPVGTAGAAGTLRERAGGRADICLLRTRTREMTDGGLAIDTPGFAERLDRLGKDAETPRDSTHYAVFL